MLYTGNTLTHSVNYYANTFEFMIYLLTATGLPPGGGSTVHIYTKTIHRMTQNKQYKEKHKNFEK